MGRKIPGRKHRGVRDPEKQAAIRYNSIKDKINSAPSNPDDQHIPRSLQRIIDLKNRAKNGDFDKKNKKMNTIEKKIVNIKPFKGKPEKTIPLFKQKPGETDRIFVHRMNKICMDFTVEAKFEEKYGVEIKRNDKGEVEEVVKRPKDELEIILRNIRNEKQQKIKLKKNKSEENNGGARLSKSQKWTLKKKQKKLKKKSQNLDEFQSYKDNVKFGEMVHAPPTLVTPKKVEKIQNAPRPGMKPLLLKNVFQDDILKKPSNVTEVRVHKVTNKAIDKKGKRKDLPHALRRQLEKEQKGVISAYKVLKAKKYVS